MDYAILETEWRSGVDLVGVNCEYYILPADLTMDTTINSRQTSSPISYVHMQIQLTCIPLTKHFLFKNA